MKTYRIRDATREDCEEIRRLIQELADCLQMPSCPEVNAATLARDGFEGENPLFMCLVIQGEEGLVGYALYYLIYSTWTGVAMHLEDIYITPSCRKQGLGKTLFTAVAKKAVESNCRRLDFSVLDSSAAKEFYESCGARNLTRSEGWLHYRLHDRSLTDLAQEAS